MLINMRHSAPQMADKTKPRQQRGGFALFLPAVGHRDQAATLMKPLAG